MKYEMLCYDKIEIEGHTLYRIKALKDFGNVEAGDIGGYIEKEENLSQKGSCWVYDSARVYDDARVLDNACVDGDACVCGKAWISDNARVSGSAWVYGNAEVYGDARVCDSAWVYGDARVSGNAQISKDNDVLCITPIGSRNGTTTFFKTKDNICVTCGCFYGTIDEFLEKVNKTHGKNKHAKAYKLACELARVQIELEDKINENDRKA